MTAIIIINKNDNNKNKNKKKKTLNLFHFDNYALTTTLLPRKLVHQIFWFSKYTLYLHRELICYH